MLVLGMVKVKDYGLFRPNADSGKGDVGNAKKSPLILLRKQGCSRTIPALVMTGPKPDCIYAQY